MFLGSNNRMETTVIPALGYPFIPMPIAGFRGLSVATLTLPLQILQSVRIAYAAIKRHRPHAVLVAGAYVSYPAGIAAGLAGVPLIVMESNLNPGKTNARLAKKAAALVVAFPESKNFFPPEVQPRIHVLGNPVRGQILDTPSIADARQSLGLKPDVPTVFVVGGSLGAQSINTAIEQSLHHIADAPYQVLWQTGRSYSSQINVPENVVRIPYVESMGSAFVAADLVVSRSGATTIAELGIVGRAAVLVPLPSASTNEQQHNANVVAKNGGAVVVQDADLRTELLPTINRLMHDDEQRNTMLQAMKHLGKPTAAADVARLVLSCGGWTGGEQ